MKLVSILGASCAAFASMVLTARGAVAFDSTFITSSQLISTVGGTTPIGFAYAGDRFVGSANYSGGNQLYQSDLTGTTVSTFGGPISGFAGEIFVASSLNTAAYGANNIYAGAETGGTIVHFSHDGSSQSVFASGLLGGIRSIAFDPYGLYGNQMVVATNAGYVYTVNTAGVASVLTYLGRDTEGLAFSNVAFGGYAQGTLFAASEGPGAIRAINPNGTGADLPIYIPDAESVHFVPLNIGLSANPVEGFYGVNYPLNIQKASAGQFIPYAGHLIATSEYSSGGPIWDISYNAGQYSVNQIGAFPNQPEDSIFVTAEVVQQHGGNVPDGGTTAVLLGAGLGALAILRRKFAVV